METEIGKYEKLMDETNLEVINNTFTRCILNIRRDSIHEHIRRYGRDFWPNLKGQAGEFKGLFFGQKFEVTCFEDKRQHNVAEHISIGFLLSYVLEQDKSLADDSTRLFEVMTTKFPDLTLLITEVESRHRYLIERGQRIEI